MPLFFLTLNGHHHYYYYVCMMGGAYAWSGDCPSESVLSLHLAHESLETPFSGPTPMLLSVKIVGWMVLPTSANPVYTLRHVCLEGHLTCGLMSVSYGAHT